MHEIIEIYNKVLKFIQCKIKQIFFRNISAAQLRTLDLWGNWAVYLQKLMVTPVPDRSWSEDWPSPSNALIYAVSVMGTFPPETIRGGLV